MLACDTSAEAQAVQVKILRSMSGEKRLLLAMEMSLFTRDLARSRIRSEHPEWTEVQIARELPRIAFLPAPLPPTLR
jgi:hypothetical protein